MAELWPKKRMTLYGIIGIFRDFLAHNLAKYQHFSIRKSLFAISQFATFNQLHSPKKIHTLHRTTPPPPLLKA